MRCFYFLILPLLFACANNGYSQVVWFPSGINIQPFTANFLEPRAGFSYIIDESNLRLDIGTTTDIFLYEVGDKHFSVGADLFTYTRLRGESNFHFPVETIDYLFGINAGYKISIDEKKECGFRFRLSHISSHLVDGAFDTGINNWRDNRNPRTYSREFIELFPYYRVCELRVYLGLTYLVHVNPDFIGKGIYQAGFDYYANGIINDFINPFVDYDFKLSEVEKFSGNNIIETGIKLGEYDSKGISVIFSYYSGKSIHGEYFNINEKYATLGLNVDL
jgi:hypothetical protein